MCHECLISALLHILLAFNSWIQCKKKLCLWEQHSWTHITQPDNSHSSHITEAINKCLFINLKEIKGFVWAKAGCRCGRGGIKQQWQMKVAISLSSVLFFFFFLVLCVIMCAMCWALTSAAWCYQHINPPMARFKVKAEKKSLNFPNHRPFQRGSAAEPPVTASRDWKDYCAPTETWMEADY